MRNHHRRARALAAILAALAGYVDASGFIATGGYFVSFMSGNSTRFGVALAERAEGIAIAAGLISAFLTGVVLGSLIGHRMHRSKRTVILLLVGAGLAAAAALGEGGQTTVAIGVMALVMGAVNNVFERDGEVSLGVTYMTGSLVKLGQRVAAALLGSDRYGWASYFVLWLSFVIGVVGGATASAYFGLSDLWLVAVVAFALAYATRRDNDRSMAAHL